MFQYRGRRSVHRVGAPSACWPRWLVPVQDEEGASFDVDPFESDGQEGHEEGQRRQGLRPAAAAQAAQAPQQT